MGDVHVSGGIRGDVLKITGDLKVLGNCEAENLALNGSMNVGGLLNAERIDINMYGPCRTQEIGGGAVTVKRSRTTAIKKLFNPLTSADLTVDMIEGDMLHLEHTRAALVRGNRVTIGPGCEIGRVEYRSELKRLGNAVVREQMQL